MEGTLLEKIKGKREVQLVDLDLYIQHKEASSPYIRKALT